MDVNELIENLYQHYEDYGQETTQNFFEVCLDCKTAAYELGKLLEENKQLRNDLIIQTALAQNGQSAVETNRQLLQQITTLKSERDAAIEDIKKALDGELICDFCKNDYKCQGEECDKYTDGRGVTFKGRYIDEKWTCMDFNYGTCPKLENTPCNGCFDNQTKGFEWRGNSSV